MTFYFKNEPHHEDSMDLDFIKFEHVQVFKAQTVFSCTPPLQ